MWSSWNCQDVSGSTGWLCMAWLHVLYNMCLLRAQRLQWSCGMWHRPALHPKHLKFINTWFKLILIVVNKKLWLSFFFCNSYIQLSNPMGAWHLKLEIKKVVQLLRALIVLPEDLSSIPSTYKELTTICKFMFSTWDPRPSGLQEPWTHMVHRCTCRRNTHTHYKYIDLKKKLQLKQSDRYY